MKLQNTPDLKRLLVIRRNRMGDMICTTPLLHALRLRFPQARIDVACDREGAPIAQSCGAVNTVRILGRGWFGAAVNAMRLRGYDAVIAVKGGFDKRLATLARMTDAPVRIGFESTHTAATHRSRYYTHPVAPASVAGEHQIETCLRLLEPLGIENAAIDLSLKLPEEAASFARATLKEHAAEKHSLVAVINASSNRAHPLPEEHLVGLIQKLVSEKNALIAISSLPSKAEQKRAQRLAQKADSASVFVLETPGVLQLGAVIAESGFVLTPEGGVGHLAASMGTPALILWSEGPFEKWKTHAANHRYLRLDQKKGPVSTDEIWREIDSLLSSH